MDTTHGFSLADLDIRVRIEPGQVERMRIVPQKAGHFTFKCDRFCGLDHESMKGQIIVTD
jgi:cytochrome c oxidase subunit 2